MGMNRQCDFRIYKGDIFTGIEAMLEGIARKVEIEQEVIQANSE